jgi:hypothetical protein
MKLHKKQKVINLISSVGNTNTRMGLDIPEVGSGA